MASDLVVSFVESAVLVDLGYEILGELTSAEAYHSVWMLVFELCQDLSVL